MPAPDDTASSGAAEGNVAKRTFVKGMKIKCYYLELKEDAEPGSGAGKVSLSTGGGLPPPSPLDPLPSGGYG